MDKYSNIFFKQSCHHLLNSGSAKVHSARLSKPRKHFKNFLAKITSRKK